MRLNLRRLKLHPREKEEFAVRTKGDDQFLAEMGGRFLAPVVGEVTVENTGSVFAGQGWLDTKVQLPCSRCLESSVFPIHTEFEMVLVDQGQGATVNPDEGFVIFDGDEADIESEIQQAIFMALPMYPLCSGDCLGLCSVCGQDRNVQPCHCVEDKVDPRLAKLKDLL